MKACPGVSVFPDICVRLPRGARCSRVSTDISGKAPVSGMDMTKTWNGLENGLVHRLGQILWKHPTSQYYCSSSS